MKMMRVKLNQYGFSLVEIMVVVAIMGILASIAIPQYQKYQRKSMQNEAKLLLSGIYTSERVFISNWGLGATNFHQLGFNPKGSLNYNVGWGDTTAPTGSGGDTTTNRPPRYSGPIVTTDSDHRNTEKCCVNNGVHKSGCAVASMPTRLTLPANSLINNGFRDVQFTIGAAGDLSGDNKDQWTMDHRKRLTNTQSGL